MSSTINAMLAALALAILVTSPARADDPFYSDLAGREPVVRDLTPHPLLGDASDGATLTVTFSTRQSDERRDYGGTVALTLPTDGFLGASSKAKRADGDAPPASPGEPGAVPRLDPSIVLPLFRPRDARAAISAALERAGVSLAEDRLDDLDTRARWSGLMPGLRLRATRLVDESISLSPTSYDAERTTMRGGASLWLEARATFQLDRLVFANEELRIERLRQQLATEREKLVERVLANLFAWQRHAHALYDPLVDTGACMQHALQLEELAVRLDLLTDGWFSDWQLRHPLPEGSCLDQPLEPPAVEPAP
jgi:hypothetical protein